MKLTKLFGAVVVLVASAGLFCEAAAPNLQASAREREAEVKGLELEEEKASEMWRAAEADFGPDRELKIAKARLDSMRVAKRLADARLRKAEANQMRFGGSIPSFFTDHVRESRSKLLEAQQQYDSVARVVADAAARTSAARSASQSPAATRSSANSPSGCQEKLAYLSGRLYRYADRDLVVARNAVLETNIVEVIANYKSQGRTTNQAAGLLLEQAKEYDRSLASARAAVYAAGDNRFRGVLGATLSAIDSNKALPPGAPALDTGIVGSAVKGYILAHWGKLANREVAIQVACHAARGL